jgi:hypothetical protein
MATKTVDCPECGAAAAPGRFACADCGALLASVGPVPAPRRRPSARRAPRAASTVTGTESGAAVDELTPSSVAAGPADEPAPERPPTARPTAIEPAPEPVLAPAAVPAPSTATSVAAFARALDAPDDTDDDREIDEDAPLAAAMPEPEWPSAPVAPAWLGSHPPAPPADVDPASAAAEPTWPDAAEEPSEPNPPAWPPMNQVAAAAGSVPRTPAGSYLAPSAVLPPLDAAASRTGDAASPTGEHPHAEPKSQATLAETLAAFGITADTPRLLIGTGAAIAGLGFLLPWAEVVIGSGLAGSYWARWGMAGPGHWIVVAFLVTLVGVALAKDRLARVPVGPIAIALGMLLVGLVWPYLFGVIGHSVGVWLVLIGAIVLATGGILDLRRHATASPDV